ncbi:MAG TPA: protoglobin domain-containing protein, partial [Polyangia bacterium]
MSPPHPTTVPSVAPSAPGAAELEARTAFLDLGPADAAVLDEFGVLYSTLAPALIERFYEHLLAHPVTARLLQDEAVLAHLKAAQARYFAQLFGGRYDAAYARDRLRVGAAHQRVGLAPAYYTGAYALYLRLLMPSVLAELAAQPDRALATLEALLKVVFLDIGLAMDTYLEAQQQDLRALRDFADRVIASVPVALVVVDAAGCVQRWNRAFERLLGGPPATGGVLAEVLGAPALARRLPEVLRGDAPRAGLLLTLHIGAGSRPARLAMAPLASPAGEAGRVVCVIEDLSEEVRLSSRLQATDRQLHGLLERSRDAILLTRPDGTIAFCNAAAEALFGYGREELCGA